MRAAEHAATGRSGRPHRAVHHFRKLIVTESSPKIGSDPIRHALGQTPVARDRRRHVRLMKKLVPFTLFPLLTALPAYAQVQADPAGSSPLLGALNWVQGTLLGNVATSAAVIAIAVVGFLMLTGRIEWRRGLVVVVGAFIIFGAVSIVAGIRSLAGGL